MLGFRVGDPVQLLHSLLRMARSFLGPIPLLVIALRRTPRPWVPGTSFARAVVGDHLKNSHSQYLMLQIKVAQDIQKNHFTKEKTATSVP